jgi:hypothetical protein
MTKAIKSPKFLKKRIGRIMRFPSGATSVFNRIGNKKLFWGVLEVLSKKRKKYISKNQYPQRGMRIKWEEGDTIGLLLSGFDPLKSE